MSPSFRSGEGKPADPPRWWDEVEAFVALGKGILVGRGKYEKLTGESLPAGTRFAHYEAGEELPDDLVTPRVWDAWGDRIAAMDETGERLDRPAFAERSGDISSEGVEKWRRERGIVYRTVEVYECDECGKQFQSQAALSGHMGSHVTNGDRAATGDDPDPEADADADDAAAAAPGTDADESDEGGEAADAAGGTDEDASEAAQGAATAAEVDGGSNPPPLTPEAVEAADTADLRAMARTHAPDLDSSMSPERLRVELRGRAADAEPHPGPEAADMGGGA